MITFNHRIYTFTPEAILAQLGLTSASGAMYFSLIGEVRAIIEVQVLVAAERLNKELREAYRRDMSLIFEYSNFPDYIKVMDNALSHPRNIGVYRGKGGLIQAKFVDIEGLGDLGDLQRIQKLVYPLGGDLKGWIGIYKSWLAGLSNKYEEIVNARIAIMLTESKAPFWQLIEDGNGSDAYPTNPPMRTLLTFKPVYSREMKAAYLRTIGLAKGLIAKPSSLFLNYQTSSVIFRDKTYYGHAWVSRSGQTVFSISGTTAIDKLGRITGRGFILSRAGAVLRMWSGWLPR